jgi:hypothetical protein
MLHNIRSLLLSGSAVALLGLHAPVTRADDTWLCGDKIIMIGATQADVLQNCGEPTSKTGDTDAMREGRYYEGTAPIEQWTYATDTVTRVLRFDKGVLVSMEMK